MNLVVADVEAAGVPAAVVKDVAPSLVLVRGFALQQDAVASRVVNLKGKVRQLLRLRKVVHVQVALLGKVHDALDERVVHVADDGHARQVHRAAGLLALLALLLGLPVVNKPVAADHEEPLVPLLEVLAALEHVTRLAVRRVGVLGALEQLPFGALRRLLLLLHRRLGQPDEVQHAVVLRELGEETLHGLLRLGDFAIQRRTCSHCRVHSQ